MTVVAGAGKKLDGLGPAFWRMWTASVISRFGDALRGPALSLVAAGLTRDPKTIALVVIAGQLPWLLFGLVGGALADRWDRRLSMAGTDTLRFFLVAGLAFVVATGRASVAVLVVFAFALSTVGTLFDSSAFAMLPELVPPDRLTKANGRMQVGGTVFGSLLGAPVAGGLFVLAAALPFAMDAVTFAVAAMLALTLPRGQQSTDAAKAARTGLWREAFDGVRWLVRQPELRLLALLSAGANLVIGALLALVVLLVLDVFKVPEAAYGLFTLVGAAGGICGGLAAGRLGTRWGSAPVLRWTLAGQAVALGVLASVSDPIAGGAVLGLFTAGSAVWNVLSNSYQQRAVPKKFLGRVGAASRVLSVVSAPVGAAAGGLAADQFGVASVVGCAAVMFAVMTAYAWRPLGAASATPYS